VVRALVFGVIILLSDAVGYRPYGVSLIVLAVLAIVAILRLAVLGTELFNFFDPSSLSTPLPGRFTRAVRLATDPATARDEGSQRTAHRDAAATLQLYRRIAVLLSERPIHDSAAPTRIVAQLLRISAEYGGKKNTIPTTSQWWDRVPTHANWLTLDHDRLGMALATATGVAPELTPDPLWVEQEISAAITGLLATLNANNQLESAIQTVDMGSPLVRRLASHLEVEEALLLQRALADGMLSAATSQDSSLTITSNSTAALNRLAAAERCILPLTELWLGYVGAAQGLINQNVAAVLDGALTSSDALYRAALPRTVLDLLERFAFNIELEIHAEQRRITPPWWVHHYGARALSQQLLSAHEAITSEVERRTLVPVKEALVDGRHDLAAIMIFAALELVEKINAHQPTVISAFSALALLRNDNTGDIAWPEMPAETTKAARIRDQLLRHLATCAPMLHTAAHDPAQPDLFGQAYRLLFETVFEAILEGESELAKALIRVVFFEADAARTRLLTDLAGQRAREQFVYSSDPYMGLMELSGYALLMQELDGDGCWPEVRGQRLADGAVQESIWREGYREGQPIQYVPTHDDEVTLKNPTTQR
jgi:hypothetical protein